MSIKKFCEKYFIEGFYKRDLPNVWALLILLCCICVISICNKTLGNSYSFPIGIGVFAITLCLGSILFAWNEPYKLFKCEKE